MTQPIDRETIRQFAEESGIRCFDEQIVAKLQNVAKLAVAHSRKDAEPVSKLTFEAAWAEMEKRGYRYGRDALAGVKFGWKLHEDWNTTNPPEADTLLQQALEALEYRLQQTRPIHQADVVMESIRTYLENKNA